MRCKVCGLLIVPGALLTACGAPVANDLADAQAAAPATSPTELAPIITVLAGTMPDTTPTAFPALPPATCAVTQLPAPPFIPPAPYPPTSPGTRYVWYGTESLWTTIPKNGVWDGLPHNPEGYTQKILWWRKGYVWTEEPQPALTVTGRRLDAAASALNVARATNAYAEDIKSAMLVGVDFPTLGCWEITGTYADQQLSFVVWVAP